LPGGEYVKFDEDIERRDNPISKELNQGNFKQEEQKEAELYPEICDGYEAINEDGKWVVAKKPEAFTAYAREYVFSGVIGTMSSSTVKVLNILASLVGRQRFTKAGNKRIAYWSGLSDDGVKRALRELKYYNVIVINNIPGGSRTKRLRRITIQRWDTALPLLIKENKVVMEGSKVTLVMPYPYKREGVKSTHSMGVKSTLISVVGN